MLSQVYFLFVLEFNLVVVDCFFQLFEFLLGRLTQVAEFERGRVFGGGFFRRRTRRYFSQGGVLVCALLEFCFHEVVRVSVVWFVLVLHALLGLVSGLAGGFLGSGVPALLDLALVAAYSYSCSLSCELVSGLCQAFLVLLRHIQLIDY